MLRRPPSYTLTDTLFPYSTLVRSPVRPTNPVQANPARQRSRVSIDTNRSTQRLVSRNKRTNGVLQNYFCIERLVSRNATGMFYVPKTFLAAAAAPRSEEHTSELQSLMRISYAVFCLKQKTKYTTQM